MECWSNGVMEWWREGVMEWWNWERGKSTKVRRHGDEEREWGMGLGFASKMKENYPRIQP